MGVKLLFPVISAIMFFIVITGCVTNNSTIPQIITQTPDISAIEFTKNGFDAYINEDYETALDYYNKSTDADPKYIRAWSEKGNVLIKLNRTREAIYAYDSALALDNNLPDIWNRRGEALMTLGRYEEARDSFEAVLQIYPSYPKAIENRDIAIEKLKV